MSLMQRCYYYDQVEFALIVYKASMSFACGCFVLVLSAGVSRMMLRAVV